LAKIQAQIGDTLIVQQLVGQLPLGQYFYIIEYRKDRYFLSKQGGGSWF